MRFSVQLPTDRVERADEFESAGAIAEVARAAEAAGFDAVYVTEHPIPSDDWLASGGHHSFDPFVALSAAAVATERIALHTNILVLPYRNPFLTAKAVASLDVLSGGRVVVGVAAGYLEGEYAALGADFAHRNELCDEALETMRRAWTGESLTAAGRGWRADGNTALPRPVQRPGPPIWVGGNSRRAMRRAVEHGSGWSPFPVPARFAGRTRTGAIESAADLGDKIARLHAMAREQGRAEPLDVNFVPFGRGMNVARPLEPAAFLEQTAELAEVGVTWLSVGVEGESRGAYLEGLARFGEEIIRPLNAGAARS